MIHRPMLAVCLLALLAASAMADSPGAEVGTGKVSEEPIEKEPDTGVAFLRTRMAEDGKTKLSLTGLAIRDKRVVLNFNVYAYGLYIDIAEAGSRLAPWKGKSAKVLQKDKGFYAALLKDDFAKSLRLVFVRNVDGDDVESAFSNSITPRVKRARKEMKMPDASEAVRVFKSFFAVDKLRKGDEVIFTWLPGGKLETTVKGKRQKQIVSEALCWALFDIYLGEKPIESKGNKTLFERVPSLLK